MLLFVRIPLKRLIQRAPVPRLFSDTLPGHPLLLAVLF